MTNLGLKTFCKAIFALIFVFISAPAQAKNSNLSNLHGLMDQGLWYTDAQRGYKVTTAEQAIQYCLAIEKRKHFQNASHPLQIIIQHIIPSIYTKYKKDPNLRFGVLSLNEMFTRFQEVRVCENYYGHIPIQADPDRTTDLYLPEHKYVILNSQYFTTPQQTQDGILLHVFLGASGYEDNKYELTHALMMAEKSFQPYVIALFPQSTDQLYWKPVEKPLPKSFVRPVNGIIYPIYVAGARGGGFTGSGGGGDSASALIKKALYNLAPQIGAYTKKHKLSCQHTWSNPANYIADIKALSIESKKDTIEKLSRNPSGGYYIRLTSYIYENGKDVTAENHSDLLAGIIADYCQLKYGGK